MAEDEDEERSPHLVVRALRSTVGQESTTFGFSILVTVVFGALQAARGTPSGLQLLGYAAGAVLSFSLLEAALSRGYRVPMPEYRSRTRTLETSLNLFSVLGGSVVGLLLAHRLESGWAWLLCPLAAGIGYLLIESLEAAAAERLLTHAGECDAAEVEE